jgi:hypothetical protein
MPIRMTRDQLEFWRELLAPFPDMALSVKRIGGNELTYIDKRSLENRLDTVVGPDGWYPEYRDEGGRGLVCRLHLQVPTRDGSWRWMHKEDGGADESMTKKVGQNHVEDVDNNFKSEFTNSFRRAAQDAWGIGRYLYQKGIPEWLDPSIPAEAIYGSQPTPPVAQAAPVQAPATTAPASAVPDRANILVTPPAERIDIPAAGRDVYAWAKTLEQRFRTQLLGGMKEGAATRGLNPTQMYLWPQEAVNGICLEAIDFIKSLPTYQGEFEHVQPQAPTVVAPISVPPPPTATVPPNTGDPLASTKKELLTKIGFHIERQLGVKPTTEQLKAGFQTVASECQTGQGHVGEIPDNLKDLADGVWLRNMVALVDENIRLAPAVANNEAENNETPF